MKTIPARLGIFALALTGTLIAVPVVSTVAVSPAYASSPETTTMLNGLNSVRESQGLADLKENENLNNVAAAWAKEMSISGFRHNPNVGTQIPTGWSSWGENIAYGYTPTTVTDGWRNSPGHYRNMIGDFTDVGHGYYVADDGTAYFVQVFAKYRSSSQTPTPTPTPTDPGTTTPSPTPTTPVETPSPEPTTPVDTPSPTPTDPGTTTPTPEPTEPTILKMAPGTPSVSAGAVTTSTVQVKWNKPAENNSPIIQYQIRIYDSSNRLILTRYIDSGNVSDTTFDKLDSGKNYYFTVTARNGVGNGISSSPLKVTTALVQKAPGIPSVSIGTKTDKTIDVKWTAAAANNAAIDQYQIRIYNANKKLLTVKYTNGSTYHWNFDKLAGNTLYYFTVTAHNSVGNGTTSALISTRTNPTPTAPGVAKVSVGKVTRSTIDIKWSAPAANNSAINQYQIKIYNSKKQLLTTKTTNGSTYHWNFDKLNRNTTYYFTVTAKNGVGTGSASGMLKANTSR